MLAYIKECPVYQEATLNTASKGRAFFKMVLQTVDDLNRNRRVYPKTVISQGMETCKDRMTKRCFFGELDHPIPEGNSTFDPIRQTTVLLKYASHIITDYYFEGNKLIGHVETTSNRYGKDLHGFLLDKIGVGMSMRGMAELERLEDRSVVKGPLTIISYDAVSMPSHSSAVVDFNEMRFEKKDYVTSLTESKDLICANGKCYLPDFFDKLVETKVIKFFESWV